MFFLIEADRQTEKVRLNWNGGRIGSTESDAYERIQWVAYSATRSCIWNDRTQKQKQK